MELERIKAEWHKWLHSCFPELLFDLDNMRRRAAFQAEKPDYLVTQDENSFHDLF